MWQWEPEEVAKFVGLVDGMEFFAQVFIDNHVTGLRFLRMNNAKLAQLGINTAAARENLTTEIALLRKWGVSKHVHWYVTEDDHQPGNIIEGYSRASFNPIMNQSALNIPLLWNNSSRLPLGHGNVTVKVWFRAAKVYAVYLGETFNPAAF